MKTVKKSDINRRIPELNYRKSKNPLFPKYFNNFTIFVILTNLYKRGSLVSLTNFIVSA